MCSVSVLVPLRVPSRRRRAIASRSVPRLRMAVAAFGFFAGGLAAGPAAVDPRRRVRSGRAGGARSAVTCSLVKPKWASTFDAGTGGAVACRCRRGGRWRRCSGSSRVVTPASTETPRRAGRAEDAARGSRRAWRVEELPARQADDPRRDRRARPAASRPATAELRPPSRCRSGRRPGRRRGRRGRSRPGDRSPCAPERSRIGRSWRERISAVGPSCWSAPPSRLRPSRWRRPGGSRSGSGSAAATSRARPARGSGRPRRPRCCRG